MFRNQKSINQNMSIFFFTVLSIVFFTGCEKRDVDILIVLPDGLVGDFHLVESVNGRVVDVDAAGRFKYEITKTGRNEFVDLSPFYEWHSIECIYQNGTRLPNSDTAVGAGPDDLVLDEGNTSSDGELFFSVLPMKEVQ
ncbi:MAG: hypothetical protein AAGG38_06400 [Planctomycetota bacterium]